MACDDDCYAVIHDEDNFWNCVGEVAAENCISSEEDWNALECSEQIELVGDVAYCMVDGNE